MDKQTRLAFRILASLYPDKKPSEIKKIITDALKKKECSEDVDLWMVLAKNVSEEKTEETPAVEKKVVEEHHYYHYDWAKPWYSSPSITYTCTSEPISKDTITCGGSWTGFDGLTISSDNVTL
ncbi:MAG: hypothetical protein K5776_09070 [Lachnospiraceae bacterium]|nr:hypothetical protein [Lachnospiraceae bacterium]